MASAEEPHRARSTRGWCVRDRPGGWSPQLYSGISIWSPTAVSFSSYYPERVSGHVVTGCTYRLSLGICRWWTGAL